MAGWGESKPSLTQVALPESGAGFVLVDSSSGQNRVYRLLSTDPLDYLRPELAPGEPWMPRGG